VRRPLFTLCVSHRRSDLCRLSSTTLSVLLTHFFFLSRLYTISFHQHKRPLRPRIIVGTLTLAAIATCGLGLYCTIELFKAEWLLAVFGLWKEITAFASLTMVVDFGIRCARFLTSSSARTELTRFVLLFLFSALPPPTFFHPPPSSTAVSAPSTT
jgi:hypothetical protein